MTCPTCQAQNPAGARFCNNCGTLLATAPASAAERRLVSILFADVVGSTALAERVDPEEWTEVMNGVIRFMINAVTRYEGTVARLMGDGILALFGAPASHEDDAERAVLAALAIRDAAAEHSARLLGSHGFGIAVRSGVNTGLSVLTRVGDEHKAEYTAMGDAANLAARLQSLAPPQGVLIGPDTHALVRHAFVTRPLGPEVIKGKASAVAVYEVTSAHPTVGKARGLDGGLAPFVGREAELRELERAASRAQGGEANLALVVGEAGLGKSRLLAELKRELGGEWRWLEGRAISYARTAPYHPWKQLLTASLGLPADANEAQLRAKLSELHERPAGRVASPAAPDDPDDPTTNGAPSVQNAGPEPLRPALFESLALLLGLDDPTREVLRPGADPEDAGRLITAAVAAHLRRLALDGPLAVVLEDLHWADQASLKLLENLAGVLGEAPVLLLATLRPERRSGAWPLVGKAREDALPGAGGRVGVLDLAPLPESQAAALLDDLMDIDDMPEEARSTILEKAEGNPFYLEEVLRSLIVSGHIVKLGDRWRARAEIVEVSVPDTLVGVLSGRLDGLPERTRRVAQTASVIGREFASRVLGAVLREPDGDEPADLEPQLRTLTAEELINETALQGDIDYRFKHELTRDAAYDQLLLKRRRELHGRVADELARLYGDREDEIAEDLAHHYHLAEGWQEAARWSLTAAGAAKSLYALSDAAELAEAALSDIERALAAGPSDRSSGAAGRPQAEDIGVLHASILLELINLAMLTRAHEDPERRPALVERAMKAVALARASADERTLVTSLVTLGNVHVLSGYPVTGFDYILEAQDLAKELGDEQLFLLPLWVASEILLDDDPAAAAKQFDQVIELARKVGNKDIEAHALGTKTLALARLGKFAAALDLGQQAVAAGDASGSIIKRADVRLLVGSALLEMGELQDGLDHIGRGTELALSVNGMECAINGLYLLGVGQIEEKRLAEAQTSLNRSLGFAVDVGYDAMLHNVRASLASIKFLSGDVAATVAIEQEIDNAEALKDGYGAARARVALAEALLAIGNAERAKAHARAAAEWFAARDMRPYVLRSLNLLSAVLSALGDEQGSEEAARRAAEVRTSIERPAEGRRSLEAGLQQGRAEAVGPGGT